MWVFGWECFLISLIPKHKVCFWFLSLLTISTDLQQQCLFSVRSHHHKRFKVVWVWAHVSVCTRVCSSMCWGAAPLVRSRLAPSSDRQIERRTRRRAGGRVVAAIFKAHLLIRNVSTGMRLWLGNNWGQENKKTFRETDSQARVIHAWREHSLELRRIPHVSFRGSEDAVHAFDPILAY